MSSKEIELSVKAEYCFEFNSFQQWVNKAGSWFKNYGKFDKLICIDRNGRAAIIGEDFMKARDEDLFPIKVYRLVRTVETEYNPKTLINE